MNLAVTLHEARFHHVLGELLALIMGRAREVVVELCRAGPASIDIAAVLAAVGAVPRHYPASEARLRLFWPAKVTAVWAAKP